MVPSLPLHNKKVLITRSEKQSEDFINQVLKYGGEPVPLPLLAFQAATLSKEEQRFLRNASSYDWLIFTSVNGIEFFFRQLEEISIKLDFRENKIAVVGEKTKAALSRFGHTASLMPTAFVAESVIESFKELDMKNQRVLYVRGNLSRDVIPVQLRLLGANVDELTTYETYCPTSSGRLTELLSSSIDVLTFTSPSTVHNFVVLLEGENWKEWTDSALICCIGPITKAAAEKVGLSPTIVPATYTMDALLQEIVNYFTLKEEV
ncbi:uroporphyrinogen-III synthase [Bacillus sp. BGMRC 2118]|nr:uroporphyrinogen-III synthase [Bacillus sp. BGMRC 2118]